LKILLHVMWFFFCRPLAHVLLSSLIIRWADILVRTQKFSPYDASRLLYELTLVKSSVASILFSSLAASTLHQHRPELHQLVFLTKPGCRKFFSGGSPLRAKSAAGLRHRRTASMRSARYTATMFCRPLATCATETTVGSHAVLSS
jgi:hypothetical protein